jgi:hypothetical protein
MHKPLKFSFTEIINAVADGKGVAKERLTRSSPGGDTIKATDKTPPAAKKK